MSHKEVTLTTEKLGKGAWVAISVVSIFREQRVAVKQIMNLLLMKTLLSYYIRRLRSLTVNKACQVITHTAGAYVFS